MLNNAASVLYNVGIVVVAIVAWEGSEGSPVVSDSSSAVTQCAWRLCTNHGLRGVSVRARECVSSQV